MRKKRKRKEGEETGAGPHQDTVLEWQSREL
jgi:hypothetical protein